MRPLQLPPEIEEYRLLRALGRGAMGEVHLAQDTLLDRLVAIKFISAAVPSDAARDRLYAEARAAARITHTNVVAIHRISEFRRQPFIVTEYVRGTVLGDLELPIEPSRLGQIARDLARGLAAAHRRGVLHRDIKPANAIISEDGVTKLLDFGVAEIVGTHGARTSLAGTPRYMAPELWAGAAPSVRSDIFSLGVLLFELCCGQPPFAESPRAGSPLDLRILLPATPEGLRAVIERCIAPDPVARYGSAESLCEALDELDRPPSRHIEPGERSPYLGLRAFDAAHRDLFFGRRTEASAIRERLRSERFVVIAGDSGTGKSSLCRAGILPLIEGEQRVVHLSLGRDPMSGLCFAIASILGVPEDVCRAQLDGDPMAIARSLRSRGDIVVFVDQLEELITEASRPEASLVSELLHAFAYGHAVRILATARSDFLTRLAGLPGLGEALAGSLWLLRPLSRERLIDVVVEPAAALGVTFETEAMIDQLVADPEASLPLLQFALAELWEARDRARGVIPASALAPIGGLGGALARHADGVIASLPAPERAAARDIIVSLVTPDGTRAHREHDELVALASSSTPHPHSVLSALVAGRLLVALESEATSHSAYTLAHDALIERWATLRRWLGEDVELRAARQRLQHGAREWDRLGRPSDALWSARQLDETRQLDRTPLSSFEQTFRARSRRAARRRRILRWAAMLAIPGLVASGALALHLHRSYELDGIVDAAAARAAGVRERRDLFERARARAHRMFDDAASDAEKAWRAVQRSERELDAEYAAVEEQLERVLQEDPGLTRARGVIAGVIYDRAILAEAGGRTAQRDDLVRRLSLYGAAHRWSAPARVAITAAPSAPITVRRYRLVDGRFELGEPTAVGSAPASLALEPGSVVIEAGGVQISALLRPNTSVTFDLSPPSSVPEGMVFVPAGPFLFGSTGADDVRDMFSSQPLHEVSTRAHMISREETTYGAWLAYLRSLPPTERTRAMPKAAFGGYAVELREIGDAFELAIGPPSALHRAREGELLDLPGRPPQDWARLPVTGISFLEARSFTRWLAHTGRVPRARPCTEYEWERAARGADGRAYPMGTRLEPRDANFDETYGRRHDALGPDAAGSHPASDNAQGVHDLVGNVFELTSSFNDPDVPVARGGCFFQSTVVARPENRAVDVPDRRDARYGFRVCADAP